MKAEEIIWGGNNKCEVTLSKDIQLPEGALSDIEYDYIKEKYIIKYKGDRATLEVSNKNKDLLDGIYLKESKPATLVRIIDKEALNYIIEVKVFHSMISFNSLQTIKIQIGDEIIQKIKGRDREAPIDYLNGTFKYKDMVFVKGYGKKGASFTLLSKYKALHIRQENNIYIATNLVNYDQSKAEYDAVYILRGEIELVNSTHSAYVSREVAQKMEVITSGGEYFDIWEAYNDLDRIFTFKQATENGILKYSSYTCELTDAFEYCFNLSGIGMEHFTEGQMIDCTDNDDIINFEKFKESDRFKKLRSMSIGSFDRVEGNKCYIIDKEGSSQKKIPNQGYLFVSIVGDSVRLNRREKAKSEIIAGITPVSNLSIIISKGVGTELQTRDEIPITKKLKAKFPEYKFNDEQQTAIEVAINTPDIALILGPPGTGKTTVIKAIITRYEEYWNKHNDGEIPKILVSSFQHEAVENVIVGMDSNGLPSERKGGRRNGQDKQSLSIRKWRDKITQRIEEEVKLLSPEIDESQSVLRDQIFAWKEKGQEPVAGIELLKEAFKGNRLKLSSALNESINEVLSRVMIQKESISKQEQAIVEEEQEEIKEILLAQRIILEAYEDDGKRQAYRLKYAIIQGVIDNNEDVSFIDAILSTKGKDKKAFKKYVEKVEALKAKYIIKAKQNTAISDVVTIEQCLKQIDAELEKIRLSRLENRNEAIAYILKDYLEQIQDEKEIEKIIEKYSNVTAATCQQAMEIGEYATKTVFDLVIVDEAARANPLDLLIPMSMGKQVILVGDHKQLPHMLDPDVVKQFEADEKMKELGILKESLFERLFRAFDNDTVKVKRTARLSKQYRMHPVIGEFASEVFYKEYPLDSSKIDVKMKLARLGGLYNDQPIAWINLDKNHYGMEEGRQSKSREKEADRIISEVRKVLEKDCKKSIGIISFYRRQSELIQKKAKKELTDVQQQHISVGTVDAFQGKEFDIVFLSCVRANTVDLDDKRHRIGHIDDISRLCVSFTRAKQLLVVVGDRDTVECVEVLGKFINKCVKGDSYFE